MAYDKQNIKIVLYPILYWIIFIIIPYIFAFIIKDKEFSFDVVGYTLLYIIFFAPLLYIFPYLLSKSRIKDTKGKMLFVLYGLVIPYLIIYLFLYKEIMSMKFNFIL